MALPKLPGNPFGAFSKAPAGAPKEVSKPLAPDTLQEQIDKAKAHERTLKPLAYESPTESPTAPASVPVPAPPPAPEPALEPDPLPSPAPVLAPSVSSTTVGSSAAPGVSPGDGTADPVDPAPAQPPSLDTIEDEFLATHPAASTSDSPSRGQPRPSLDPGKAVTGGFGLGGGTQYFGLDGTELHAIILSLLSQLKQSMAHDLRLGLACVYPQVRVTVGVQVTGIEGTPTEDQKFDLTQSRVLTLAVIAQDDDETPADALRDHAGLPKPMKQSIRAGAATILVDVPNPPSGA